MFVCVFFLCPDPKTHIYVYICCSPIPRILFTTITHDPSHSLVPNRGDLAHRLHDSLIVGQESDPVHRLQTHRVQIVVAGNAVGQVKLHYLFDGEACARNKNKSNIDRTQLILVSKT